MSPRDVLRAFAECDGPATLVTVVEARGSTPCAVGDRMLVGPEGWRAGSVGGGRLEAKALALCAESADRMQLVTWNLQTDVGMTCGGAVTLLVERTTAPWQVVVYGAGHVAQALVRVLLTLDCQITVCDPRPEWTSKLPADARLRVVDAYDPAACPPGASVVLMTQGHRTDLPVLHALLLRGDTAFLGVIGSEAKARTLRRELAERGFVGEAAFQCPVGWPVGGNAPAEIAISVAGALLGAR